MQRLAIAGRTRERAQELHVGFALLLEMVERILGICLAIQVIEETGVIGLQLRQFLGQETVHTQAVAMAFGMRKVRQHFGDGEAVWRRLPARIFFGNVGH